MHAVAPAAVALAVVGLPLGADAVLPHLFVLAAVLLVGAAVARRAGQPAPREAADVTSAARQAAGLLARGEVDALGYARLRSTAIARAVHDSWHRLGWRALPDAEDAWREGSPAEVEPSASCAGMITVHAHASPLPAEVEPCRVSATSSGEPSSPLPVASVLLEHVDEAAPLVPVTSSGHQPSPLPAEVEPAARRPRRTAPRLATTTAVAEPLDGEGAHVAPEVDGTPAGQVDAAEVDAEVSWP